MYRLCSCIMTRSSWGTKSTIYSHGYPSPFHRYLFYCPILKALFSRERFKKNWSHNLPIGWIFAKQSFPSQASVVMSTILYHFTEAAAHLPWTNKQTNKQTETARLLLPVGQATARRTRTIRASVNSIAWYQKSNDQRRPTTNRQRGFNDSTIESKTTCNDVLSV